MRPRCIDCLTEDVTTKITDQYGFGHWFCATDWEANQRFHDAFMKALTDGAAPASSRT